MKKYLVLVTVICVFVLTSCSVPIYESNDKKKESNDDKKNIPSSKIITYDNLTEHGLTGGFTYSNLNSDEIYYEYHVIKNDGDIKAVKISLFKEDKGIEQDVFIAVNNNAVGDSGTFILDPNSKYCVSLIIFYDTQVYHNEIEQSRINITTGDFKKTPTVEQEVREVTDKYIKLKIIEEDNDNNIVNHFVEVRTKDDKVVKRIDFTNSNKTIIKLDGLIPNSCYKIYSVLTYDNGDELIENRSIYLNTLKTKNSYGLIDHTYDYYGYVKNVEFDENKVTFNTNIVDQNNELSDIKIVFTSYDYYEDKEIVLGEIDVTEYKGTYEHVGIINNKITNISLVAKHNDEQITLSECEHQHSWFTNPSVYSSIEPDDNDNAIYNFSFNDSDVEVDDYYIELYMNNTLINVYDKEDISDSMILEHIFDGQDYTLKLYAKYDNGYKIDYNLIDVKQFRYNTEIKAPSITILDKEFDAINNILILKIDVQDLNEENDKCQLTITDQEEIVINQILLKPGINNIQVEGVSKNIEYNLTGICNFYGYEDIQIFMGRFIHETKQLPVANIDNMHVTANSIIGEGELLDPNNAVEKVISRVYKDGELIFENESNDMYLFVDNLEKQTNYDVEFEVIYDLEDGNGILSFIKKKQITTDDYTISIKEISSSTFRYLTNTDIQVSVYLNNEHRYRVETIKINGKDYKANFSSYDKYYVNLNVGSYLENDELRIEEIKTIEGDVTPINENNTYKIYLTQDLSVTSCNIDGHGLYAQVGSEVIISCEVDKDYNIIDFLFGSRKINKDDIVIENNIIKFTYLAQEVYTSDRQINKIKFIYNGKTYISNNVYPVVIRSYEEGDLHIITSAQDFQNISGDGVYVLANDIDFNSFDFKPIMNFSGYIDGNGYTVKNITISDSIKNTDDDKYYAGIFGYLSDGTVSNINFENISVETSTFDNEAVFGLLAGYSNGNFYKVNINGVINAKEDLVKTDILVGDGTAAIYIVSDDIIININKND